MTLREWLVLYTVEYIANWNFRAYRQEQGDIDQRDYLSQSQIEMTKKLIGKEPTCPYAIVKPVDCTELAIEHILLSRLPEAKAYYNGLSVKGFNRLLNQIEKEVNQKLERKIENYKEQ